MFQKADPFPDLLTYTPNKLDGIWGGHDSIDLKKKKSYPSQLSSNQKKMQAIVMEMNLEYIFVWR